MRKRIHTLRARLNDETGSLSAYLLVIVVVLTVLIGIVVDGSGKYDADARAQQVANSAARAAVNSINGSTVLVGSLGLNAAQAQTTAENYVAAAGMTGSVSVAGQVVTVNVQTFYKTKFLSLIGVSHLPGKAKASAQLITQ